MIIVRLVAGAAGLMHFSRAGDNAGKGRRGGEGGRNAAQLPGVQYAAREGLAGSVCFSGRAGAGLAFVGGR